MTAAPPPLDGRVGDWLLLPTGQQPPASRRGGAWSPIRQAGGLCLYTSAIDSAWAGAPWRRFEIPSRVESPREVWIHGEIYPLSADPQAAIRAAALGSKRALGSLDGHFLWIERHGKAWMVATNRFGTLHAYASPGAVSSSFDAALAAGSARRLDWTALAGFFDHGFFPGDSTYYSDIRLLGPARSFTVRTAGGVVDVGAGERTWEWHHTPRAESFDDAVDGFAEVLGSILHDLALATPKPPALPISGGLDSRSTVAALPPGYPGWAFSYGWGARSIETRLAQRIATARRLDFEAFRVEPYLLEPGGLPRALATGEGFQDVTLTRQLAISTPLAAQAETVICAHWGDVWLDDLGLADRATIDDQALVEQALGRARKRGGDWLLEHLRGPRREDAHDALRRRVAAELDDTRSLEAPDARLRAWKTDGWSHRWTTGSLRAHQAAAFPRLPFYSTRLADFCLGLAPGFVAGRRLQIESLRRHAPDLARIPWQQTGMPLGAGPLRRALDPARRAAAKALRIARRERVVQRNWETQLLGGDRQTLLRRRLLGPAGDGRQTPLGEWVDGAAVCALLDAFEQAPTAARGYTVAMLLTLSDRLERDA